MQLLLFVFVMVLVHVCNGDPGHGKRETCFGTEITISEKMNTTRKTCWDKIYGDKSWEDIKTEGRGPHTCLPICDLKELGVMSTDNKFDKTQIKTFIEYFNFPKEAVDPIVAKWTTCIDEKGNNLDIKERNCENAEPLINCLYGSINEVCRKQTA